MIKLLALASAIALGVAAPASAATQLTDGTGHLTGATGVVVNGSTYDVAFVDGTCAANFGNCDALSDFAFNSSSDATAAANALFAQVVTGTFDTDPTTTFGCAAATCVMIIPYGFTGANFDSIIAINGAASNSVDSLSASPTLFTTTENRSFVWARFTAAGGAVPEPSTWAMMLLGFAGVGLAIRRRRSLAAA